MTRYRGVFATHDGQRLTTPAMFGNAEDAAWHVAAVLDAADEGVHLPYAGLRTLRGERASTIGVDPDGEAWVETV